MAPVAAGQEADALQFVEGGLVYRLPWAMEAIRVRAIANGDALGVDGATMEDVELGLAVAAVETGTLNRSGAILIQAGFSSRIAAIKAVTDTNAQFENGQQLREWLTSDHVAALTAAGDWPTPETASLWADFRAGFALAERSVWAKKIWTAPVAWDVEPTPGEQAVRLHSMPNGPIVLADDARVLGRLAAPLNPARKGLLRATVLNDRTGLLMSYVGPDDLWLT